MLPAVLGAPLESTCSKPGGSQLAFSAEVMNAPTLLHSIVRLLFSWRMFLCLVTGMVVVLVVDRYRPEAGWIVPVSMVVVIVSLVMGWRWHRTADFL